MSSPSRTTIAGGLLFDGVSPLLAEATIVVVGENGAPTADPRRPHCGEPNGEPTVTDTERHQATPSQDRCS